MELGMLKEDETQTENHSREELSFTLGTTGELLLWNQRGKIPVTVRRCFPWSRPTECLSIRNRENEEVMFIVNVDELSEGSRQAVLQAVRDSGFFFTIRQILEAREEFELRHWVVDTDQGRRRFQTRLDEWPRELPGGELLVRDLYGDVYQISSPATLDSRSRELLWAFVE